MKKYLLFTLSVLALSAGLPAAHAETPPALPPHCDPWFGTEPGPTPPPTPTPPPVPIGVELPVSQALAPCHPATPDPTPTPTPTPSEPPADETPPPSDDPNQTLDPGMPVLEGSGCDLNAGAARFSGDALAFFTAMLVGLGLRRRRG